VQRVFITRAVEKGSRFREILEQHRYTVVGQYLIDFQPVAFAAVPDCDWLFFYSGKGVQYFFEGLAAGKLALSTQVKLAALGKGTAQKIEATGRKPDFVGTGDPQQTAQQFLAIARGAKVVFPHARHSKRSVQRLLGNSIDAIDLVVYKNEPLTEGPLPTTEIVVLTSPLNVKAYFQRRQGQPAPRIVAIGETTAEALRQEGVSSFLIAEKASEEGLAQAVLSV
jgi:uroporphyrinogen-III synthase